MERHDGALGVGPLALHVCAPVARRLALAIERVDLGHPHAEGLLHGVTDLDLGGPGVDDEDVDAPIHEGVALLGDNRADEHGHGVTHRCRPPRRTRRWRSRRWRSRRWRPRPRARARARLPPRPWGWRRPWPAWPPSQAWPA